MTVMHMIILMWSENVIWCLDFVVPGNSMQAMFASLLNYFELLLPSDLHLTLKWQTCFQGKIENFLVSLFLYNWQRKMLGKNVRPWWSIVWNVINVIKDTANQTSTIVLSNCAILGNVWCICSSCCNSEQICQKRLASSHITHSMI